MAGPPLHGIEVGLRLPRRSALALAALEQTGEGGRRPRIRVWQTGHGLPVSVRFEIAGLEAQAQRLLASLLAGAGPCCVTPRLRLEDIFGRLESSNIALDHVGLTIPVRHGSAARLSALQALLAPRARIVAHPGAPAWLFIMPGRRGAIDPPKFEIALGPEKAGCPTVQLDVRTPYSIDHLRALFPPRERQAVPILQDHAVSVFARVPWRRFALRIDLRARPGPGELSFTDWLLRHGGRARAASLSREPPP